MLIALGDKAVTFPQSQFSTPYQFGNIFDMAFIMGENILHENNTKKSTSRFGRFDDDCTVTLLTDIACWTHTHTLLLLSKVF